MVCLKKTLEKGYLNRKHEREREYVAYASEPGGGGASQGMFGEHMQERVCLDVWRKGLYGENIEERVCLEKHFRKGMFGENISNGMFEENI